MNPLITT